MTCNVIATGSQGNAVVLDGTILLDCGVPFGALEEVYHDLSLVVLTHIHGDHFRPETIKRLSFLRPALRFLGPPWLYKPLRSLGIYERVIDMASTAYRLSYGRLGGTWHDIQFEMQSIPHDVPNCAWHIFADRGSQREAVFYATDCGSLDGVEAKEYDLYLIEANYGEEEIQERMARKLAAGGYSYESRCMESHLSQEQAEAWLSANAKDGWSKVLFLHQHRE